MSRKYRTLEDWRAIIEQQEACGESVVAFCQQQGISPKYFWNRRRAVRGAERCDNFVAVAPPKRSDDNAQVTVNWRDAQVSLPASLSPAWLAELLRALDHAAVS